MLLPLASQARVYLRSKDNAKIALKKIPAAIVTYIDEEAEYGIHLFITQENRKSTEGSNNPDPGNQDKQSGPDSCTRPKASPDLSGLPPGRDGQLLLLRMILRIADEF